MSIVNQINLRYSKVGSEYKKYFIEILIKIKPLRAGKVHTDIGG